MGKRLQTILAHAGVASRRHSAKLIETGQVKVDGRVVREKGEKFDPQKHEIMVDNCLIPKEESKYYFLFNKPKNVISTVTDTHARKKVTDYFKEIKARLYPIGRLDKDTTGVLILTNDGDLAHKLSHPRFEIDKEYVAIVEPPVPRTNMKKLREGVRIEGKLTSPCEIKCIDVTGNTAKYKIILHEGRKRQIRLMFKEVCSKVIELQRNKYAGLKLGRLKEGEYRELTDKEVARLRDTVK